MPVVTEVRTYTVWAFVSDIGGLLSLLSIAAALLFPVAQQLVIPRSFVLFVAWRWIHSLCHPTRGQRRLGRTDC